MESTAPARFHEIKGQFPVIAEEKKAIMEEIVKIQGEKYADSQFPIRKRNDKL